MIVARVVDKPGDQTSPGPLRALYGWLKGETPATDLTAPSSSAPAAGDSPSRIAHYTIERKLGQGGMGVVYAAQDGRLKRAVALKMISSATGSADIIRKCRHWSIADTTSA